MRTWLPFGLALVLPVAGLLGACGGVDTEPTGGGGGTTTSSTGGSSSTTTPNPTGGAGGVGNTGGIGGTGGTGGVGNTGGEGGGQGGGPPPANDACPGELLAPALGETLALNGTLKGANDNYMTFCADTSAELTAPDVVYQLDLAAAATVSLEVKATGFIPAISLRFTDCSSRPNGTVCINLGTADLATKFALEPGTHYIVVDSADGGAGDFDLNVTVAAPACGDGATNAGEQCDPGDDNLEDGCFNAGTAKECQFGEPPLDPAIVQCPGGLVTIGKTDSFALGLYNTGSGQSQHSNEIDDPLGDGSGPCAYDSFGPENVFQLVPTGSGTLTVTIGHDADLSSPYCDEVNKPNNVCGDFIFYIREGNCNNGAQLTCIDFGPSEVLTLQQTVTANTPYWIFVDTYQDDPLDPSSGYPGPYFLEVALD